MTFSEREHVVAEARSWIGTPYHKKGRVKGAGADCFTFIAEVMVSCGIFDRDDLPAYQDDWFFHQSEEVYLKLLYRHCAKTLEGISYASTQTLPGNIVVMKTTNSKVFNHGGIVVAWPSIIHCIYDGVSETNISRDPMWAYHRIQIFDPWVKP